MLTSVNWKWLNYKILIKIAIIGNLRKIFFRNIVVNSLNMPTLLNLENGGVTKF